ncbi:MAG: hypothetical protein M0008_09525 [Actinomycetota bacterium]|nr:hypothetical protein [Actinomycetota bacterium]
MHSRALTHAFKVLEKQTGDDPALAEAVVFLAEELDGPDDPFADVPEGARLAARPRWRAATSLAT